MALYSEKVMDHFENPRNVGKMEDADGIGEVGNAKCGDIMRMYIKVKDGIITDVKFNTFGCGSAIATSSMATELIKGKPIEEALELSNKAVVEALDGLPAYKLHCSVLAEEAVRAVWAKYRPKVCGATMGARGSMCFDGRDLVRCPAFPVEKVVDTTGCGDLFHAAFAVRWLETHDLLDCQRFAAATSALKCRGLSGRPPAAPTRAEVEAFLSAHPKP